MPKAEDPFYNRKPVPDEFIRDIVPSGLSAQEEHFNRERKYSDQNGVDVRKFGSSKSSGFKPSSDPYYGRKRVSDAETTGVAESGLSAEEEYVNRERKYSVNGVDVRRFSTSKSSGFKPMDDPYYGRKQVDKSQTQGVAETGYTPAEEYETRERKQSVVNFSSDPFQLVSGQGHRQSISGGAGLGAAATRRRSSAGVGPDGPANGTGPGQTHSGYAPDNSLQPIVSRAEGPGDDKVSQISSGPSTSTNTNTNGAAPAHHSDIPYHDASTALPQVKHQAPIESEYHDPDAVGPHGER